ncbi:MAG TPA: response regulator [Crinalium sp.]|jgi:two-component system cell cycle response regulator DivK
MGKRILLVEDNDIHRLLTEEFFKHQGYAVLGLHDGNDFFSTLSTFQPDLVVLDLKLPGIDGFTLLEQLQPTEWKSVPIIVVSAYTLSSEKQRALDLGVRRYLTKPINLEVLGRFVESELSNPPFPFLSDFPTE